MFKFECGSVIRIQLNVFICIQFYTDAFVDNLNSREADLIIYINISTAML